MSTGIPDINFTIIEDKLVIEYNQKDRKNPDVYTNDISLFEDIGEQVKNIYMGLVRFGFLPMMNRNIILLQSIN